MDLRPRRLALALAVLGQCQVDRYQIEVGVAHAALRHDPYGQPAYRRTRAAQHVDLERVLVVERRLPESTVTELDRRGHIVEVDADWCEGRLTAAARDGRRRRAAANPRGMQAYAAGR